MKISKQDQYYLDVEADAFLERNKYDFSKLPEKKKKFVDYFEKNLSEHPIKNILEIGCHIGDLLNYTVKKINAERGYGIEPSSRAVQIGSELFSSTSKILRGTAGNTELFSDLPSMDLIMINDVFCWISRETVFQSIANIDDKLAPGGLLMIRDFFPDRRIRNKNRHAANSDIYCHKIPGSHAAIFLQSGNYQVINSRTFVDGGKELSAAEFDFTENRWMDVLLRKGWQ